MKICLHTYMHIYLCVYIHIYVYAYIIHVYNYIQSYKYFQQIYPQVSLVGQDDQFAAKKLPTGPRFPSYPVHGENLVRSL